MEERYRLGRDEYEEATDLLALAESRDVFVNTVLRTVRIARKLGEDLGDDWQKGVREDMGLIDRALGKDYNLL